MCETHSCAHAVSGGQESLQRCSRNPGPQGFLGQRRSFEISRCDQSCREGSKRRQGSGRARSVPSKANSQRTTSCGSDCGRPPAGAVVTLRPDALNHIKAGDWLLVFQCSAQGHRCSATWTGAGTGPGMGSPHFFSAGPSQLRSMMAALHSHVAAPLDFHPAATHLQTQSSHRSTRID